MDWYIYAHGQDFASLPVRDSFYWSTVHTLSMIGGLFIYELGNTQYSHFTTSI
jgi:hypothetical protein